MDFSTSLAVCKFVIIPVKPSLSSSFIIANSSFINLLSVNRYCLRANLYIKGRSFVIPFLLRPDFEFEFLVMRKYLYGFFS